MTTYSYNIDFSHFELRALETAIKHYLEHLDDLLASGTRPENEHGIKMRREQLQSILQRRYDSATMMSTSSFLHPDELE
jgi:hypothetical protein